MGWLVAAALLIRPPLAKAAAFEVKDTSWEGCSALLELGRAELGEGQVVPLSHLDWSALEPEDALFIMHPDHAPSSDKLAAFLAKGGRVAVIDDFGAGDQILARFQIERVPAPSRPFSMLRNNPSLAIAEPAREAGEGIAVHATVQDVERLVTNHPTGLRNSKLTPVLTIRASGEPDVLLALAGNFGTPPRGKLLAMGDPSVFINEMLRYPGNRAFAVGLFRYLSQGSKGRVYVVANQFAESGAYPGLEGWRSELAERFEGVEQMLRRLASEGFAGGAGLALAGLLAFGVGLWTTSVASRPYRRRMPSFARPVPLVAQGGLAGRAAVLSAPTTPRALVVLELKNALQEGLSHELGFAEPRSPAQLLDALKERGGLDEARLGALKKVALEMATIETWVAAGRVDKTKKSEVARIAFVVFDVLAAVREHVRRSSRAA